jgi:hypothetical protein
MLHMRLSGCCTSTSCQDQNMTQAEEISVAGIQGVSIVFLAQYTRHMRDRLINE